MRDDVVLALVGASASDRYCSRLFSGRQLWCADDLCYQLQETAVGRIAKFVPACRAVTGKSRSAVIAVYATPIDGHYEVPLWVARTFDRVLSRAGIVLLGDKNMKVSVRSFFLSLLVLGAIVCAAPARAALITDSTTFTAFSVTYDNALWGNIKFPHEADSFSQTLPISQFGFGRWFFDPNLSVSSDGSAGPPQLAISGEITLNAKPGWGLYHANFTQSGQWATSGSGTVSVDGSFVDVVAPNAEFFFTNHQAFTSPLVQNGENASGFYYIIGERSSFSRFDQLTISYDLMLQAGAMNGMGSAHLFSDISDPSFLGNPPGPYPNSNIVGTFISVSFERTTPISEPSALVLALAGLLTLGLMQRLGQQTQA